MDTAAKCMRRVRRNQLQLKTAITGTARAGLQRVAVLSSFQVRPWQRALFSTHSQEALVVLQQWPDRPCLTPGTALFNSAQALECLRRMFCTW